MPSLLEWERSSSISWWHTMCKCNPHGFLPRQWLRRGGVVRRGAVIGRSLPLWLSDRKLGPLNTVILMMTATLLVVLAIWLPFGTSSVRALFVVVVLLGIGTGSSVPLGGNIPPFREKACRFAESWLVACVSALCEPESTGTWVGSVYSVASAAYVSLYSPHLGGLGVAAESSPSPLTSPRTLIGNPSTGAILERFEGRGLVVFLAIVLFTGLVSMTALRWLCHGRRWMLVDKI